jgi:hypothetical protein
MWVATQTCMPPQHCVTSGNTASCIKGGGG